MSNELAGHYGWIVFVVVVLVLLGSSHGQSLTCETQSFTVSTSGPVSVAISFDLAVAGFPSFGPQIGQVAFYRWDETFAAWEQAGTFTGENAGDQFGASVAVRSDCNLALVGAPGVNDGAGAVYEFVMNNSTGKWAPTGVVFNGEAAGDAFGYAVSTTSTAMIIGAPHAQSDAGKAYIYDRESAASAWTLLSQFTGATAGANLGFSVNMAHSASNCAAGAPSADGSLAGSAMLYCRAMENETFALCMENNSRNPTAGDLYGYSVASFADYADWQESGLFVGSPGESLVYLYNSWYGDYTYNETISAPTAGEWGRSVAVDTTFAGGSVLPLVGAPSGQSSEASHAYALTFSEGYWGNPFVPSVGIPNIDPNFGSSVALSRGTAMIGTQNSVTFWCTGVDY